MDSNIKILYKIHSLIVMFSHSALLCFIIYSLIYILLKFIKKPVIKIFILAFLTMLMFVLTYLDAIVYNIYNFHINSYILGEITQPDFEAGSGISNAEVIDTILEFIFLFLSTILITAIIFYVKLKQNFQNIFNKKINSGKLLFKKTLKIILIIIVIEKSIMFYTSYNRPNYFYRLSNAVPIVYFASGLYLHIISKTFIKFNDKKEAYNNVFGDYKKCKYPKKPLTVKDKINSKCNIIIIFFEATRSEFINKTLTPNIYNLQKKSFFKENHFAGSNSTHLSIFPLLYSINAYYNIFIKTKKIEAIPLRLLRNNGYETSFYYSGALEWHHMDYFITQNFDKIIHLNKGERYKRDQKIIDAVTDQVDHFNNKNPKFIMAFFDSTHYNYSFPQEKAKYKPFLEKRVPKSEFLKMSKLRPLLLNSYYNSLNHLDEYLAKLFKKLEKSKQINNTIIFISSDHGMEFGEDGHYFYSSTLTNYQTKVPFILYIPEKLKSKILKSKNNRTACPSTHSDIFPTIFDLMNYSGNKENFQGYSIFGNRQNRPYSIVTFQSNLTPAKFAIIDENAKLIVDRESFQFVVKKTDLFDKPIHEITDSKERIKFLTDELNYFKKIKK